MTDIVVFHSLYVGVLPKNTWHDNNCICILYVGAGIAVHEVTGVFFTHTTDFKCSSLPLRHGEQGKGLVVPSEQLILLGER